MKIAQSKIIKKNKSSNNRNWRKKSLKNTPKIKKFLKSWKKKEKFYKMKEKLSNNIKHFLYKTKMIY